MHCYDRILSMWRAAELASALSIENGHARVIKARHRVPTHYWEALLESARNRGLDLTLEQLAAAELEYQAGRATHREPAE